MTISRRAIRIDADALAAGIKRLQQATADAAGVTDLSQMGHGLQQFQLSYRPLAMSAWVSQLQAELAARAADAATLNGKVLTRVSDLQATIADFQQTDANAATDAQKLLDQITDASGVPATPVTGEAGAAPGQVAGEFG
ncbi:hypothetical protein [Microbacterium sp. ZW T5_56]|uniref:hypothetical protein n=1 Tax=Microbacterium sp. ZW T5_56 TaxID=3378081 RepID=UPI0038525092